MEKKLQKTISYRFSLIYTARFMPSLLSIFVDNFAEEIYKLNVITNMMVKNVKNSELSRKLVSAVLKTQVLKMIQ